MLENILLSSMDTWFTGKLDKTITMPNGAITTPAVTNNGNIIYVYGGWVDDSDSINNVTNISNKFFSFNVSNDAFTNLTATPGRRSFATLEYHEGSLYMAHGRYDGASPENVASISKYVISTGVWTTMYADAGLVARMGSVTTIDAVTSTTTPTLVSIGGSPHVLNISAARKEMITYRLNGSFYGATQYQGTLLNSVRYSSSARIGNNFFIVGGSDANGISINKVKKLVVGTATVSDIADCPIYSSRGAACEFDGKLYLIGGYEDVNATVITDAIYEYNPVTNTWALHSRLPFKIMGHSITKIGRRVYLIGGWVQGLGRSDKIYVLR